MMLRSIALLCTLSVVCGKLVVDFDKSKIIRLEGQKAVNDFIKSSQVRIVYYYKKDVKYLKFFFKELEKSTGLLEMYGVKTGFCNCTEDSSKDVQDCKKEGFENSAHTYRSGSLLLSLELETMFDVNSIMSNILQLVMLREVPILQTVKEVEKFLGTMKGKKDIIFGHMKAIGTFDHRVFMEVAYAYMNKLQFAICTDMKATKLFQQPKGRQKDVSSVWWIWTKEMSNKDQNYQNMYYRGDLNLKALATFVGTVIKPKLFSMPSEGLQHPYPVDTPIVRFYFRSQSAADIRKKANKLALQYAGHTGIVLINLDEKDADKVSTYQGRIIPTMSFQFNPEAVEQFLPHYRTLSTDNIANFMEENMGSQPVYPNPEDDEDEPMDVDDGEFDGYTNPEEEEWKNAPPHDEDVEKQDDRVAYVVDKAKRIPMPLDLLKVANDKTFPDLIQADTAVIMLYFPFDSSSMGNLRMFGEAAEMLGKSDKVTLARVNCYDWTDVCTKENITIFPTLRVYSRGKKLWDYTGPQDIKAMYSTLKLLEMSLPVYESSGDKVKQYITQTGENTLTGITNTTVVGLFRKGDKQEIKVFKELAETSRERIMFVYTDSITPEVAMKEYGASLPTVILAKYDDSVQPFVVFEDTFKLQNLQAFIENNKLPKLPVLTPLLFPEVRRKHSEMVILFTDSSDNCRQMEDSVREIVKAQQFNNVSFNLMQVPSDASVGYRVLEKYTHEPEVPHLSLVKFTKGEVFNFFAGTGDVPSVTNWLTGAIQGEIQPSTNLLDTEWKPRSKGYEFLKIMDWEAKKAIDEKSDHLNLEEVPAERDEKGVNLEDNKETEPVDDIEDEDDSETRKDLFALKDSRLYHQGPGRAHHHGDKKDRGGHSHDKGYSTDEGYNSEGEPSDNVGSVEQAEKDAKLKHKHTPEHTEL